MKYLKNTSAIFMCLLIIGLFTNFANSGENVWTTNGPAGGSIKTIAISPANSQVLFIGTIQEGIYKSTNGGDNWIHIDSDIIEPTQRKIAIHPFGPDTIYASTVGGVFKSIDGGENWFDISPGGRHEEFRDLIIDPIHPNIILTGGPFDQWKSTDSGNSWYQFSIDFNGMDVGIEKMAMNPLNPNTIYLITESVAYGKGIYKSIDEGESWFRTQNNCDSVPCYATDIAIDPIDTSIIYYAREDEARQTQNRFLYKSTNGGASWAAINPLNLNIWGCRAIKVSPLDHNILYMATSMDGIYISTNAGETWSSRNSGISPIPHGASLEVDTSNGILYFGTYDDGIYKSTDGGEIWHKISSNIYDYSSDGLAFADSSPPKVFSVGPTGIYLRTGDDDAWQYIDLELSPICWPLSISVDNLLPSNIYVGTGTFFIVPAPDNGFHFSSDTANTWQFSNQGLPTDAGFCDLAISYYGNGARRFFLASCNSLIANGIFYSDDFGLNWQQCQGLVEGVNMNLVKAGDSGRIAASDYENRIFISTDNGESWSQTSDIPRYEEGYVYDINFDPHNANHIYASSISSGLYESFDLGDSWNNITNDLEVDPSFIAIWGPAINPYNPSNMFVSSNHRGVYQTHDGGQHWEDFNMGLDSSDIIGRPSGKIYIAPGDTTRLYLASYGRSVWSIHRTATGVAENQPNMPKEITLAAYPNPFNLSTRLSYNIVKSGNVRINIYDLLGKKIASIFDGLQQPGPHYITWNATGYSSGIYFVKLETQNQSKTIKLALLK